VAGDFDALLGKLEQLSGVLDGPDMGRVLKDVGVVNKGILNQAAQDAVGSDQRMSGWRRAGRMTAGFDVVGNTQLVMKPRPYGLWMVADRGRRATTAPRRRARMTIPTPGGPRTFTRANPMVIGSTRGKRTLTIARERIERESPVRVFEGVQRELRRKWG
jgi:hypothetical protein